MPLLMSLVLELLDHVVGRMWQLIASHLIIAQGSILETGSKALPKRRNIVYHI